MGRRCGSNSTKIASLGLLLFKKIIASMYAPCFYTHTQMRKAKTKTETNELPSKSRYRILEHLAVKVTY